MKFEDKISSKQWRAIFWFVLGGIMLYLSFYNKEGIPRFFLFLAVVFIIFSISNFFEESIKRYKITHPFEVGKPTKGEKIIADYFKRKNIKFHFQPIIKVPDKLWIFDNPFKKIKLEPDFFLPEFEVYVEFWGMLDKEEYKKRYNKKTKIYKKEGVEFISLYPKNLKNLDWDFTQKLLTLLKKREGNLLRWR